MKDKFYVIDDFEEVYNPDDDEDNADNNDNADNEDNETDESKSKLKSLQRTAILYFNDFMRVNIKSSEISMFFQEKSDNSDKWITTAYYTNWKAMLDSVVEKCIKEKMLKKQIKDYKELTELFKEIQNDMRGYVRRMEEIIQKDEYLKEITK